MKRLAFLFALTTVFCDLSYSASLEEADYLYTLRGQGLTSTNNAIVAYRSLLGLPSKVDRVHVVNQLNRLYYYKGEALLSEKSEKQKMFKLCLDATDQLSLEALGIKHQAYYHWKAQCTALWGKYGSLPERIQGATNLLKFLADGKKLIESQGAAAIEGGGLYRTEAGLRTAEEARAIFQFDPEKGAILAGKAIKSPALEDRAYPSALSGLDFYTNYLFLAQGLAKQTPPKIDKAKKILMEVIEEIEELEEDEELPAGREPEVLLEKKNLIEYLNQLES